MAKAVWREEGDILKQTMSLPLCSGSFIEYHGWDDMRRELARLGCDGLEGVWSGEAFPPDLPSELIIGYHLLFYPDWLDFYRDNKAMLVRKFGALNTVERFYGGLDPEILLKQYQQDLERAASLNAEYVVFHVSDVSIEEGYTYTGKLPTDLPRDYLERFAVNYSHILRIDQHLPWTDPAILPVLERIEPHWLTHELSSRNRRARAAAVMAQTTLLRGGGLACG